MYRKLILEFKKILKLGMIYFFTMLNNMIFL